MLIIHVNYKALIPYRLKILKAMEIIKWERVSDGTRLKFLELLLARVKNEKGMPCPHLRALKSNAQRNRSIDRSFARAHPPDT